MQFTLAAITAALGLAALGTAAPLMEERTASCSLYPWFIVPYHDSTTCSSQPAYFQPTSGPLDPKATYYGCRPLYDPSGKPASFASVSINRDACPDQKWTIRLYPDGKCSGHPVVVDKSSCVGAKGQRFVAFDAVRSW